MVFDVDPFSTNQEPDTADEMFLIFLSHKDEVKNEVQALKEGLEEYGVEAFVAHSDIFPGTEWQEKILEALKAMDAFVPILTKDFRDSIWTDQEVGYAISREVTIIPLRLGLDPYGFMGKYQGLSCAWKDAPREIIEALIDDPRIVDGFIEAVADCPDYATANRLADILPSIVELTDEQVSGLVKAFNENSQISDSYGFNGQLEWRFGDGLAVFLSGKTQRKFEVKKDSKGCYRICELLSGSWGFTDD